MNCFIRIQTRQSYFGTRCGSLAYSHISHVHYATRAHFPLSYCSTLHFPYYVTLPYFSHNKTPPIFHITLHLASHNKSTHAISRLTSHTPSFPSLIVPPSPIRSLHAILRPICHTSHGIACIISLVRRHTPS